ncbi:TPA: hypothetical protein SMI12_001253 [Serratia liquefaciens]|nr:hypothetical protein [Serratia liquefaciens]
MESISSEIFDILKYLLPGFLTAWVFHALTAHPKQNQFERIVQALIFTLFIRCAIAITEFAFLKIGKFYSLGAWNETSELIWSVIYSLLIGFALVFFANNGYFHDFLSKWKITKQTPYPSEWEDIFNNATTYVIVNLKNERRISGWPRVFPSDPTKGHLVLENPEWIHEGKYVALEGTQYITINSTDIEYVEFLVNQEIEDGTEPQTETNSSSD